MRRASSGLEILMMEVRDIVVTQVDSVQQEQGVRERGNRTNQRVIGNDNSRRRRDCGIRGGFMTVTFA